MKKQFFFTILFLVLLFSFGCVISDSQSGEIQSGDSQSDGNQTDKTQSDGKQNDEDAGTDSMPLEEVVPAQEATDTPIVKGPEDCVGSECLLFCQGNPEKCDAWCIENQEACKVIMSKFPVMDNSKNEPSPESGQCPPGEDCSNPTFIIDRLYPGLRPGDGIWDKNELTFYIKDIEGSLSPAKKEIIRDAILSEKSTRTGFLGWNKALDRLNKDYLDNTVPDKLTEVDSEQDADIVIEAFAEKEFCCDLSGEPIQGHARNYNDSDLVSHKAYVGLYNVVDISPGLFADITRHELGHILGLFRHSTRKNDLMSLESPASYIKQANLDDLHEKYTDFKPLDIDEMRRMEQNS